MYSDPIGNVMFTIVPLLIIGFESGNRIEFALNSKEYGMLTESDNGMLTFPLDSSVRNNKNGLRYYLAKAVFVDVKVNFCPLPQSNSLHYPQN